MNMDIIGNYLRISIWYQYISKTKIKCSISLWLLFKNISTQLMPNESIDVYLIPTEYRYLFDTYTKYRYLLNREFRILNI